MEGGYSMSLMDWEIDLLNRHLRDCAVPVTYEPDGSVSVGSGVLAAEKLRAMERHALFRLPPLPPVMPGLFGPIRKPESLRIPFLPGARPPRDPRLQLTIRRMTLAEIRKTGA